MIIYTLAVQFRGIAADTIRTFLDVDEVKKIRSPTPMTSQAYNINTI